MVRTMKTRCFKRYLISSRRRILENQMQSRKMERQKQEAMIDCGVLNKMTSIGMSESYKICKNGLRLFARFTVHR